MGRSDGGQLTRADQRAMLMERMFEVATGNTDGATPESLEQELQVAFRRCFSCHQAALCRRWLDGLETHTDYRAFCPNARLFQRMRGVC